MSEGAYISYFRDSFVYLCEDIFGHRLGEVDAMDFCAECRVEFCHAEKLEVIACCVRHDCECETRHKARTYDEKKASCFCK